MNPLFSSQNSKSVLNFELDISTDAIEEKQVIWILYKLCGRWMVVRRNVFVDCHVAAAFPLRRSAVNLHQILMAAQWSPATISSGDIHLLGGKVGKVVRGKERKSLKGSELMQFICNLSLWQSLCWINILGKFKPNSDFTLKPAAGRRTLKAWSKRELLYCVSVVFWLKRLPALMTWLFLIFVGSLGHAWPSLAISQVKSHIWLIRGMPKHKFVQGHEFWDTSVPHGTCQCLTEL